MVVGVSAKREHARITCDQGRSVKSDSGDLPGNNHGYGAAGESVGANGERAVHGGPGSSAKFLSGP